MRFDDSAEVGDQWVYVALEADTKLIPTLVVGKRSKQPHVRFHPRSSETLGNTPQITTDGFGFYVEAIEQKFGNEVNYAQLIKLFGDHRQHHSEEKYS